MNYVLGVKFSDEGPRLEEVVGFRVGQELTRSIFEFKDIPVAMSGFVDTMLILIVWIKHAELADAQQEAPALQWIVGTVGFVKDTGLEYHAVETVFLQNIEFRATRHREDQRTVACK